jgi:DNA topoisomerase-1
VLWRKVQKNLSAGRVQSVALRLIVDREKEIIAFKSVPFYRVTGIFTPDGSNVKVEAALDTKFDDIDKARSFLADSIGAVYKVDSVEQKEGTRSPAAPFTTSTMQQEAARLLHLSASQTMRTAQALYERGLITYMRTDSTNLSSLAVGSAKDFIINNFGEQYSRPRQYRTKVRGAQEAHEAIRPTFISNTSIEGTPTEKKLYNLIWKRTVASQMADMKVMNTSMRIALDRRSEKYTAQAVKILFDGYYKIYGKDDAAGESSALLPDIKPGGILQAKSINADCKFTQAPPRYSDGTLIKKLEELEIGRPSTYVPTIATLTTGRGYVVKGDKDGHKVPVVNLTLKGSKITEIEKTETVGAEKGKLIPQEIGVIVTNYLVEHFPDILDYDFTADVEKEFDEIASGTRDWKSTISEFYAPFHGKIGEVLAEKQYNRISRELGTDPETGEAVVAKYGQWGAYIQKGDPAKKQFASLGKGQLIESITLDEALKLFSLPRTAGVYEGTDVIVTKGRFGPYIKYGDKNITLPRGLDPMKVSLEECIGIISSEKEKPVAGTTILAFPDKGIEVINGRYGPYIKHDGANYRIPAGKDAAALTAEECEAIVAAAPAPKKSRRRS